MMSESRYGGDNLLKKLYNRELYGQFIRGISPDHEPTKQLFPTVPERLVFSLLDTLPNIGNHILMGATRCGRFLLTYTYTVDPSIEYSPTLQYRYRLHFWSWRPGRAGVKVAEVQLFDGCEVLEVLTIGIVQWPNIHDRILVFGNGHGPETFDSWGTEMDYKSTTYITVTTLPSLRGCAECKAVAASFDEEEMAANWDSGVGLTCINHGLTLHTSFTVPYPYSFEPQIYASVDGKVVLNTGSFVHVLGFSLEKNSPPLRPPHLDPPNILNLPLRNRLSYSFLRDKAYHMFLSDTWASNMIQMLKEKIQQGHQVHIRELPFILKLALQKQLTAYSSGCHSAKQVSSRCKLSGDSVISSLTDGGARSQRQQRWFSSNKNSRIASPVKSKSGKRIVDDVDKVYDFKESDDKCEPKFKLYRRRCLADKMYEFRSDEDADMENIRPNAAQFPPEEIKSIPKTDSVHGRQPIFFRCNVRSKPCEKVEEVVKGSDSETDSESLEMNKTVRTILDDWESPEPGPLEESPSETRRRNVEGFISGLLDTSSSATQLQRTQRSFRHHTGGSRGALKPRNRLGSTSNVRPRHTRQDNFELTDCMKKEMDRGFGHQPIGGCSVHFTRRFIEIDQEIISTITDIEDDEIGPGFQCALPISVHGSAYSQMEMISNQKAEKLNISCAVVTQSTLDIEHFCDKAAETICKMEGFKFWFYSDYDTEIVNVCPVTDDKLFVVFIRLNAEDMRSSVTEENPNNPNIRRADLRNFYECRCLFIWSSATDICYLEGYSGLTKVPMKTPKPWNPAGKVARSLRPSAQHHFGVRQKPVRSFVHHVKDGQIVLPLNLIMDHDNLIGFKRV